MKKYEPLQFFFLFCFCFSVTFYSILSGGKKYYLSLRLTTCYVSAFHRPGTFFFFTFFRMFLVKAKHYVLLLMCVVCLSCICFSSLILFQPDVRGFVCVVVCSVWRVLPSCTATYTLKEQLVLPYNTVDNNYGVHGYLDKHDDGRFKQTISNVYNIFAVFCAEFLFHLPLSHSSD